MAPIIHSPFILCKSYYYDVGTIFRNILLFSIHLSYLGFVLFLFADTCKSTRYINEQHNSAIDLYTQLKIYFKELGPDPVRTEADGVKIILRNVKDYLNRGIWAIETNLPFILTKYSNEKSSIHSKISFWRTDPLQAIYLAENATQLSKNNINPKDSQLLAEKALYCYLKNKM